MLVKKELLKTVEGEMGKEYMEKAKKGIEASKKKQKQPNQS